MKFYDSNGRVFTKKQAKEDAQNEILNALVDKLNSLEREQVTDQDREYYIEVFRYIKQQANKYMKAWNVEYKEGLGRVTDDPEIWARGWLEMGIH